MYLIRGPIMNRKSILLLVFVAAMLISATTLAGNVMLRHGAYWVRCADCGKVVRVDVIQTRSADHKVAGTIIGGVLGGLLGRQVGGGRGKTLATIAGAIGGGYAGNRIGRSRENLNYEIRVRMADGEILRIQAKNAGNVRWGDIVRVDNKGVIHYVGHF